MSIQERPVSVNQPHQRFAVTNDAVEKQQRFFKLRAIEPGHPVAAFVDGTLLTQRLVIKPFAAQIFSQSNSPRIVEHSPNLRTQHVV